jgi:hypothetical protein
MSNPQQGIAETRALLDAARKELHAITQDAAIMAETPLEIEAVIESVAQAIGAALRWLDSIASEKAPSAVVPGGPTRRQGQFLAFIREYMMRNRAGVAPSHADLMRLGQD